MEEGRCAKSGGIVEERRQRGEFSGLRLLDQDHRAEETGKACTL